MAPQNPLSQSKDAANGSANVYTVVAAKRLTTIGCVAIPLICLIATIGVWQAYGRQIFPLVLSIAASLFICAFFWIVAHCLRQSNYALERLQQSRQWYHALVEGVDRYAIFMLDANGCVSSWNERAVRTKGYTADEILGEHFSRFYPQLRRLRESANWA